MARIDRDPARRCRFGWTRDGQIDWDLWCIDGSSSGPPGPPPGLAKKCGATRRSRKTTRWAARAADSAASSTWLLTADGLPLAVEVTAGQVHESTQVESVMDADRDSAAGGPPRQRPGRLAGDKGYSYPRVRDWLQAARDQAGDPARETTSGRSTTAGRRSSTRTRTVGAASSSRCIGWLKECRRIGTRFEKLAINFLAMMKLAMIQRYLEIWCFQTEPNLTGVIGNRMDVLRCQEGPSRPATLRAPACRLVRSSGAPEPRP